MAVLGPVPGVDDLAFDPCLADEGTRRQASLPFDDGSFDGAFLVAVLGEIHDRAAALCELHRVLRPSSRLVVGETTMIDPDGLTPAQLRWEAEAAGFRLDDNVGGRSYLARFRPT